MKPRAADHYHVRMCKVVAYIDTHLDSALELDQLCQVAAFSKFHFLRQFAAWAGLGVSAYVQLRRLKRASYQLAFRPHLPVLDIALGNGYQGPEAFARAFKKTVGMAPRAFRTQPDWPAWQNALQPVNRLQVKIMQESSFGPVEIIQFAATPVAALQHRGHPQQLGASIRRFIAWRQQHHLPPSRSATFNIFYDDPEQTEPALYRHDLCAATEQAVGPNAQGVIADVIPAGRCARMRYTGSDDALRAAAHYLYADWLPQSGEALRDFPLFAQRVKFFPDVPEHEAVIDLFLPLS